MESSRIIELMAKKTGKSASVEELTELERLLAENPSYSYLAEILESLKGSKEHFEKNVPDLELAETGWRHLSGLLSAGQRPVSGLSAGDLLGALPPVRIERDGDESPEDLEVEEQGRGWRRLTPMWRVAAAVIVIAGTIAIGYNLMNKGRSNPAYANKSIDVNYGRRSELVLGDGTKVWLNAGSRLVYPDIFSGTSREVTLEGEAYFDVAQQANAPFLVHAGKITIKVLGTRFDVKAYREDPELSTTLISGKVQVMLNDDPEKKIILSSREKLTVANIKAMPVRSVNRPIRNVLNYQVQSLPVVGHDSLLETAWLENKLVVSNQTFAEVAKLLERKYDVQIIFADQTLRQAHLSGVFETETISQVLDILRMTTRFKYTIKGNEIRLAANR